MRKKRILKAADDILNVINDSKLTRLEILVALGRVLVHVGHTIYYKYETQSPPEGKVSTKEVYELYFKNPTLGSTLMKLGFDFQGSLYKEAKEAIEKGG